MGTLRSRSPEQALAKHGLVDHRSDVYALGATLSEMLTLQPASDGQDRQEVLERIARDEPRKPRSLNRAIPTDLETIVLKALAKAPAERYATAQELADDLGRFLEDRPIQARRPSLRQVAGRWVRRHRAVAWAAALVLLVVAAAVVGPVRLPEVRSPGPSPPEAFSPRVRWPRSKRRTARSRTDGPFAHR